MTMMWERRVPLSFTRARTRGCCIWWTTRGRAHAADALVDLANDGDAWYARRDQVQSIRVFSSAEVASSGGGACEG